METITLQRYMKKLRELNFISPSPYFTDSLTSLILSIQPIGSVTLAPNHGIEMHTQTPSNGRGRHMEKLPHTLQTGPESMSARTHTPNQIKLSKGHVHTGLEKIDACGC